MNIIVTKAEGVVEVFLLQKETVGEVLHLLQSDWRFAMHQTRIWEITPSTDQANVPKGGMRLKEIGRVGVATTAQAKLNEALWYANLLPEQQLELITGFAAQCLTRLKELREDRPVSISVSQSLIQNEVKEGGPTVGVQTQEEKEEIG